jgi:hypothetical protein
MRATNLSMVRQPMSITDQGIVIEWDKYLKITNFSARIEPLPKEEIEEMKKALEEVSEYQRKAKIRELEEIIEEEG